MSSLHSDKVQQWLHQVKEERAASRDPNDDLRRQLRDKDELLRQMERRLRGGEEAYIGPDLVLQVVDELQSLREIITGVIGMERERETAVAELHARLDSLEVNYNRNTERIIAIEDCLETGSPRHLSNVETMVRELDDRMSMLEAQPQDNRSDFDFEKLDALEERLQVISDEQVRFAIKVVDDKRKTEVLLERLAKMCQKLEGSSSGDAKPTEVPFPPPPSQAQYVLSLSHHPTPQKITREPVNTSRTSSSSAMPPSSSVYSRKMNVSSVPPPQPEEPTQPRTPTHSYLPSTPLPSPSAASASASASASVSGHLNATPQSKDRRFGIPPNK
eukprot:TRINITY_DN46650_c0_g1_i1.p1 TRINITY_DN46650_c0_g1~~TRINITY_DN46650_c0_g1_i1.p1  ORF type:complete len:338 (+),score=90.09 TRINITY_DN46650_c0_g1_i1:23-1015(+)